MMEKKRSVTLVEVVVVILAVLFFVLLFVPAVNDGHGRNARNTAVKAQLYHISQGLEMFKSDFGYYPSSTPQDSKGVTLTDTSTSGVVNGFHRLSFALLGRDEMGCPKEKGATGTSHMLPDQYSDTSVDSLTGWYYSTDPDGTFSGKDMNKPVWKAVGSVKGESEKYKTARKSPYIISEGFYRVKDKVVDPNGFVPVLCDKFDKQRNNEISNEKDYQDHSIILYFKANPKGKRIGGPPQRPWSEEIYYAANNWRMVKKDDNGNIDQAAFWDFIEDKKKTKGNDRQPVNPDTYLLISAGKDGQYFTEDDIVNWSK
jgi:type II secretory pathway pseudopilin PulG